MTRDLTTLSNSELKKYIKVHRNDNEAFHEALKVLISRSSGQKYPAPFEMPKEEVEAIFRDKIKPLEEGV
ncbi:MAG: hypothetical protein AAGA60_01105 [Cyanobacteria bacterium P01_E01_bin.42]